MRSCMLLTGPFVLLRYGALSELPREALYGHGT